MWQHLVVECRITIQFRIVAALDLDLKAGYSFGIQIQYICKPIQGCQLCICNSKQDSLQFMQFKSKSGSF